MNLTINNLSVHYGGVKALSNVSLTVNQGEMVALIGSNGAGKTTLLKAISGLVKKAQGEVLYNSQSITHLSSDQIVKKGIVQVPEGRLIFENLTVLENLELGGYHFSSQQNHEKIMEVYQLFPRLYERRIQRAGTLSGGEQQMLAIGRALMARPQLLLLDEPSLGIAPNLVQQIFKALSDIHKNGITILLVEQDAHLALKSTERAYVLETGQIVMSGSSRELIDRDDIKKAYLGL